MSVLSSQGMLSFLSGSCWSYSVFSYVKPTYFVPTYVIFFILLMISNSFFCIWQLLVLFCGGLQALLGMIMFNLGLNFGFTSLGDQVHFLCVWIIGLC
jgi:uncharacterized membrane protein YadS